jgi:hypothetical protein
MRPPLKSAELSRLGKIVAGLYRQAHGGMNPMKHGQYVDGAIRNVNSYTKDDIVYFERGYDILMLERKNKK